MENNLSTLSGAVAVAVSPLPSSVPSENKSKKSIRGWELIIGSASMLAQLIGLPFSIALFIELWQGQNKYCRRNFFLDYDGKCSVTWAGRIVLIIQLASCTIFTIILTVSYSAIASRFRKWTMNLIEWCKEKKDFLKYYCIFGLFAGLPLALILGLFTNRLYFLLLGVGAGVYLLIFLPFLLADYVLSLYQLFCCTFKPRLMREHPDYLWYCVEWNVLIDPDEKRGKRLRLLSYFILIFQYMLEMIISISLFYGNYTSILSFFFSLPSILSTLYRLIRFLIQVFYHSSMFCYRCFCRECCYEGVCLNCFHAAKFATEDIELPAKV